MTMSLTFRQLKFAYKNVIPYSIKPQAQPVVIQTKPEIMLILYMINSNIMKILISVTTVRSWLPKHDCYIKQLLLPSQQGAVGTNFSFPDPLMQSKIESLS